MKTTIAKLGSLFMSLVALSSLTGCSDDNVSDLRLDGDARILAMKLDDYDGEINELQKTIKVGVPFDYDVTSMKVSSLTLSEGASADIAVGETVNCTVPRAIKVTDGDLFSEYLLNVVHDNAEFVSFTLDNKYSGTIDNESRTIRVFVPKEADVTSMLVSYTLSEGAQATPATGSILDFSQPVEFVAEYRTAKISYTVTVVQDDMSQAPKAFIGSASTVDALGDEAKNAAMWMMENIPNTQYVSLQEIINGTVKLSDFTMVWCHFDWTDWPGTMWDSRDLFNDYYIKGGNILASRDGARYINDVWRIALDQQSPNNMFGGDAAETLSEDLGITAGEHSGHEIYAGLPMADGKLMLLSAGCSCTNRTLQWCVDWDPYQGMSGWETRTGAVALASDNAGDANHVVVAEFPRREVLKGYQSGIVITVGTPAYEWHQSNGQNAYRPAMEQFTKNIINYLCK